MRRQHAAQHALKPGLKNWLSKMTMSMRMMTMMTMMWDKKDTDQLLLLEMMYLRQNAFACWLEKR